MKRKYDETLITRMRKNQWTETYDGVPVLVKPIPEGGQPGDMDPRIYRAMRMMPLLSKLMPKPKANQTVQEKVVPLRKMFADYKGIQMVTDGVTTQYFSVDSTDGFKIPVRVYNRVNTGKNLPVFVYFHGGGFFGGSADIVEQMCKLLVSTLDCVAFNVDYRLCPENHYPNPLDDCFCATRWAFENAPRFGGDPSRLSVSGDSAGGNLAAAVTLRDREEKTGMVKLQVLIYPAVNIDGRQTEFYHGFDFSLYRRSKRHARVLDTVLKMMSGLVGDGSNLLEDVYLQGHVPADNIFVSPLLDDMHDLPPTLLIFGEHDFLVFEDFAYAKTLMKAGRTLKTIVYRGMGHGFADQIGVSPQAEDCMLEIASYMAEVL